ncbi:HET-domain-containing protein [Zopfia rhizophila CBS 207.26]|uniref:HET-domain-containing protein n=1 Tax=Zopfia rhizophila CBS 207.26 TaxID=1314779 RepID=A0A6A6EX48_9PEZI|nr:HET-domain-containing protein [Zopfia rhizophila CBS 207.26]
MLGPGWFCQPYESQEITGSFQLFRRPKKDPIFQSKLHRDFSTATAVPESLDIISDSSSQSAFNRAAAWLSYCINNHDECKVPNAGYVPHRLLNVGADGVREPFLFEPREPATYICLSYCWGPDVHDVLKTTKANLPSHYHAIKLSLLPATIRDAVVFCRGLNVSNLWVDSLCIVQDDLDEWRQDSAHMGDIYMNSLLTIAAEEPASCKVGFLGKQRYGSPEWQRRVVTEVPGGSEIFIRPGQEDYEHDEYEDNKQSSLGKRGWCLQESILPTRKLRFNGNEMEWECNRLLFCECGHFVDNDKLSFQAFKRFIKVGYSLELGCNSGSDSGSGLYRGPGSDSSLDSDFIYNFVREKGSHPVSGVSVRFRANLEPDYGRRDSDAPYQSWTQVIEEFSNRSLTRDADKLVALSGLAKVIIEGTKELEGKSNVYLAGDVYLAGLWRRDFIFGLAWHTERPGSGGVAPHKRPLDYRAPSWSWASVDGPVRYGIHEGVKNWKYKPTPRPNCTIHEVVCFPVSPADPTGAVTGGYAVLTGPLATVELVLLDEELSALWRERTSTWLARWRPAGAMSQVSLVRAKNLKSYEMSLDLPREISLRKDDARADCWIQGRCKDRCCLWESEKFSLQNYLTGTWLYRHTIEPVIPREKEEASNYQKDRPNSVINESRLNENKASFYCLRLFTWEDLSTYRRILPGGHRSPGIVPEVWYLVFQKSRKIDGAFERIGIGVAREAYCDLFDGHEISTIRIV